MERIRPDKSGNCVICGTWRHVLCRDHIIPRREGGTDDPSNIQMICANCHQDKTAREQSAAHKGRPKSLEQRRKMSAWQIGRSKPPAVRENISRSVKIAMADPELRAYLKMRAQERWHGTSPFEGRVHTEETKISLSEIGLARFPVCAKGHAFDRVDKNGKRLCSICMKIKKDSYRMRQLALRS